MYFLNYIIKDSVEANLQYIIICNIGWTDQSAKAHPQLP